MGERDRKIVVHALLLQQIWYVALPQASIVSQYFWIMKWYHKWMCFLAGLVSFDDHSLSGTISGREKRKRRFSTNFKMRIFVSLCVTLLTNRCRKREDKVWWLKNCVMMCTFLLKGSKKISMYRSSNWSVKWKEFPPELLVFRFVNKFSQRNWL